jgi:hypothetical protein
MLAWIETGLSHVDDILHSVVLPILGALLGISVLIAMFLVALGIAVAVCSLWFDGQQRRQEESIVRQQEQRAEKARYDAERQVKEMRDEVRRHTPYAHREDPAFLEQHARANASSLLRRRAEIEKDAEEFHKLDGGRLARNLKEHAPGTYKRRMWELEAVGIAERTVVEPPKEPPPRRKPTVEEVRAQKARRETVKGEDATAAMLARLAVERRAEERIAREYPTLDEDERRQKVKQIVEVYEEGGDGTKL